MIRFVAIALGALAAASCVTQHVAAQSEILAWAQEHYGDGLRGEPQIFYGDFTGDGVSDALVWTMYNDGGLHNFGEGALFRNRRGRMVFWRLDDVASGESPWDVTFAPGRIRLTTTILQDGDARCCPTGEQRWTIEAR